MWVGTWLVRVWSRSLRSAVIRSGKCLADAIDAELVVSVDVV